VTEAKRTLPDFLEPPVVETVLGVQFMSPKHFSIPHFGLYWNTIRKEFPGFEVKSPLGQAIEQFEGKPFNRLTIGVELVSSPDIRCWFINSSKTQLIQVQPDRFLHNWRKVKEDDVYPHYDSIKPNFMEEWQKFCQFLDNVGLGSPEVNQCEITYVNHIELGKGWKTYGELNKVISSWSGVYSGNFLPDPESINLNTRYVLPNKRGRLHIAMQRVIRQQDAKEVLQLNLTARGKPSSSRPEDISEWHDLGHEWIVRGFTDFTTEEMHKNWRRTL